MGGYDIIQDLRIVRPSVHASLGYEHFKFFYGALELGGKKYILETEGNILGQLLL